MKKKRSTYITALCLLALLIPLFAVSPARAAGASAAPAGMYLHNGDTETFTYKSYSAEEMQRVADVLNIYRDLLGPDGTVHMLNAPVSPLAYYLTDSGQYTSWSSDVYEVLQPLVKDGVYIYDAEEILLETIFDEHDYLSVDHHWAPLGASRFADRMMINQGIPEAGYYEYLYRLRTEYYSDNNYNRAELAEISPDRNNVQVQLPVSPVKAYELHYLTEKRPCPYLLDVKIASYDFYALYITGMLGGWRTYETGFHTGRDALIIGDSFNTAFVPFIAPYYDNITVTDIRDAHYNQWTAGATIREYMEEYGGDDVYIITCIWTGLNDPVFQSRMTDYLGDQP